MIGRRRRRAACATTGLLALLLLCTTNGNAATLPASPQPPELTTGDIAKIEALPPFPGSNPVVVGLGADRRNRATIVVATSDGDVSNLWVNSQSVDETWGVPVRVAADVEPGSADLAVNGDGIAVLAFDQTSQGTTQLRTMSRPGPSATWVSSPSLAEDTSPHGPSVGIDESGRATLAYVADVDGVPSTITRTLGPGGWSRAMVHSTEPAHMTKVAVSSTGYVTLAWIQDEIDAPADPAADENVDRLAVQRWDPRSRSWDAMSAGLVAAEDGLMDVVSDGDAAAAVLSTWKVGPDRRHVFVKYVRSVGVDGTDWDGTDVMTTEAGQDPEAAVTPSLSAYEQGQATILSTGQDAQPERVFLWAYANGFSGPTRVVREGDQSALQVRQTIGDVVTSWVARDAGATTLVASTFDSASRKRESPSLALGPILGDYLTTMTPAGDEHLGWVAPSDNGPEVMHAEVTGAHLAPAEGPLLPGSRPVLRWAHGDEILDVQVRSAGVTRGFNEPRILGSGLRPPLLRVKARPGRTLCFAVRTDYAGPSAWSPERCSVTPVDDASLRGAGWRSVRDASLYRGTARVSQRGSGDLRLRDVAGRTFGLLVSRRPDGGDVSVRLDGALLGTVSTRGPREDRVVVPVATFPTLQSGTIRLRPVGNGPVIVDGVHVGRVSTP